MGRHSSGGGLPYLLSFALWAVPYIVVASLVGFGIWAAVNTVGGDGVTVQTTPQAESPSPSPSRTTPEPTPVPEPTKERTEPEEEGEEVADRPDRPNSPDSRPDSKDGGNGLNASGVTVQVINGTGGVAGAAEAMADRLARLGYTVEAFTTGLTIDQSVVYYANPESSDEAVALAGYLGFVAEPAPPDLTPTIDLHVIVSAADA